MTAEDRGAVPGRGPGSAPGPRLRLQQLAPERALRRLELSIVRRLEGYLNGEHLGLLPGPGTELAEARAYLPGEDDVRHMDWAVTARTTVPHVHDVVADRELTSLALVDLTASMGFGTAAVDKRELAVAAVATVGFLTQRLGDRFGGFLLRHGTLRRWPARSGRLALYALLRALLAAPPAGPVRPGDVDLPTAIDRIGRVEPRRGLRVLVSDFLDPASLSAGPDAPPRWERAVSRLADRHQVLAVEIVDPRELALPAVGVVWLTDPETGRSVEVNTSDARLRERYAARAGRERDRVRAALRRAGAAHLVLRTDRDWVADTARFVLAQRRLAGRAVVRPRTATGIVR